MVGRSIIHRGREIAHVEITIFDNQPPPPPKVITGVLVLGAPRTIPIQRSVEMAEASMKVGQELAARINIQPAGGKLDGPPTWATSNDGVLSVAAGGDGLEATIRALAVGEAKVTVSASVRHGDEVVDLPVAEGNIVVTDVEAQSIELIFGEPVTPAV